MFCHTDYSNFMGNSVKNVKHKSSATYQITDESKLLSTPVTSSTPVQLYKRWLQSSAIAYLSNM